MPCCCLHLVCKGCIAFRPVYLVKFLSCLISYFLLLFHHCFYKLLCPGRCGQERALVGVDWVAIFSSSICIGIGGYPSIICCRRFLLHLL
ncbi:hypothetical protein BJ508DRAFT_56764 [Ascobolus immersus RN42]|uniref:Uncharacterized protein n=1 Tax=Ascobolus immersus RN42 TaxID=1160509 RepID=A0A3N4IDY2_ASCIM|nr:hypothetical protein BJ508DRAFT_56764 [Ascobolus immersus RN42]